MDLHGTINNSMDKEVDDKRVVKSAGEELIKQAIIEFAKKIFS